MFGKSSTGRRPAKSCPWHAPTVNFKVVFTTAAGVATKKYKGTDTYEITRGGVLRIDVQRPEQRGVYYYAPGQWIEVAEGGDPISPKMEAEE